MQTRTDATLADNLTSPPIPLLKVKGAVMQVIGYTKSMNRDSRNALLWMVLFAGVIMAGISLAKINNEYGFKLRLASSVTMLSILFTFANCNLLTSSKSGKEPWILFPSGDKSKTQSVNGGTTYHGGGNGFATGVIPVTGMYFVHSDHLGSVTMLTDGYGNPVTGPEGGGKSYISYKPYGEILRTDSGGPDISKFKYTGQEEDLESGLMYYKARYYDPYLARFLEADSVTNSNSLFGMNRYMYVEGNPVRFTDPTGHWKVSHITEGKWGQAMWNGGALVAKNMKGSLDWAVRETKGISGGAHWATKGISGGAHWASGSLREAGSSYNRFTYGRHHKNNYYEKFMRSDLKYTPLLHSGVAAFVAGVTAAITYGTIGALGTTISGIVNAGRVFTYDSLIASMMNEYTLGMATSAALINQYWGFIELGVWPATGYMLGGTGNFSHGMKSWNEKSARRGGALGVCYALDSFTVIAGLSTPITTPSGEEIVLFQEGKVVLDAMDNTQKFATALFSLFNLGMGVYGAGNGKNCEGFAKGAFPL